MKPINPITIIAVVILGCWCVSEVMGQRAFLAEIRIINQQVERWYEKEPPLKSGLGAVLDKLSDADRQSAKYHWPRLMMMVLQAASGVSSSSEIDMKKINAVAAGLKNDNVAIQKEFETNLERFLEAEFKGKTVNLAKEQLCAPYRAKSEQYFHYREAIDDLIRKKKSEDIGDTLFKFNVFKFDGEEQIAPLYAAAVICRYIDGSLNEAEDWPYYA